MVIKKNKGRIQLQNSHPLYSLVGPQQLHWRSVIKHVLWENFIYKCTYCWAFFNYTIPECYHWLHRQLGLPYIICLLHVQWNEFRNGGLCSYEFLALISLILSPTFTQCCLLWWCHAAGLKLQEWLLEAMLSKEREEGDPVADTCCSAMACPPGHTPSQDRELANLPARHLSVSRSDGVAVVNDASTVYGIAKCANLEL